MQIAPDEPLARDDLAGLDRRAAAEHRTGVDEGMELAVLAARIDAGRQVGEQRRVELAAGERRVEHARIDAGEPRAQAAGDHLAREPRRRHAPQRKQRRQPGAREPLFAIAPHVLEEQIAERDVREAVARRRLRPRVRIRSS